MSNGWSVGCKIVAWLILIVGILTGTRSRKSTPFNPKINIRMSFINHFSQITIFVKKRDCGEEKYFL